MSAAFDFAAVSAPQPVHLSPQQNRVLAFVHKSPGATIRFIHQELGAPYECVRTAIYHLMKRGLVEKRGTRPIYLSGLYPVAGDVAMEGPAA